jgi:hypothetical protein
MMANNFADTDPASNNPGRPQWWVWLVIAIIACCCLSLAGFIGTLVYFGREPQDLSVEYSLPSVVTKGENFDFRLSLSNTGNEPIAIADIDLDEALGGSILDGCLVLETEPYMQRDYSLEGIKTFHYGQIIQPGETRTFIFHLQAVTVGEFGGSIAVYVGNIAKRIDYIGIVVQE